MTSNFTSFNLCTLLRTQSDSRLVVAAKTNPSHKSIGAAGPPGERALPKAAALLFAAASLLLAGCQGLETTPPTVEDAARQGSLTVLGDWDDLWAAGMGGLSPYGWVILTETERTPTSVRYELLSVRDETGELVFARPTPAEEFETDPVEITVELRKGWRGRPHAEASALTAVATRLAELKGDTATVLPIREFAVPPSDEAASGAGG